MRSYAEKRDFTRTPEPSERRHARAPSGSLRFVVQRHHASRLHHDFRIELDGTLKSWAVPKGPSLDPKVRRQAIMVEDHPLDYADFEGVIPAREYGGGEVVIWDEGTYAPEGATGNRRRDSELVRRGLAEGKLSIVLEGKRLKGGFVLVRTEDDAWLLMKRNDEHASRRDPTLDETSIRSGLTTEDLRAGRKAVAAGLLNEIPGAKTEEHPTPGPPMVPTEAPAAFASELWAWEPKLDGIRATVTKDGGSVRLTSRTGNDLAGRFPEIAAQIASLPYRSLVLDGEIVLLDDDGRPSFEGLMQHYGAGRPEGASPISFFAFDLLHVDGVDLRACAFVDRRTALERLTLAGSRLRVLETFGSDGAALYLHASELGFEGVVGKRLTSPYREGSRSDDWLKVKGYHTEEFLVCGYTEGLGARSGTLGSLLLGQRDEDGRLRYCGSVGAGISDAALAEFRRRLDADRTVESPFDAKVTTRSRPTFVRPRLLVEVRFMSWTKERRLRAPVFVRSRPDLSPGSWAPAAGAGRSGEADSVLEALATGAETLDLTVEGEPLRLTSLSKELWPGVAKRDLLSYYASVSAALLDHLRDRPLTVVRYPDGIGGEGFFQRHWEDAVPGFAQAVSVFSERLGEPRSHLMCNNLPTLLWLGQMGAIELHPWHASATLREDELGLGAEFGTPEGLEDSALDHPDYLVCDLDPNVSGRGLKGGFTPEGWAMTVQAALALKGVLDLLRLEGFVKTTGKSGLHVFVPLRRLYTHEQVREAARTLGRYLAEERPDLVTLEASVAKRPRKVFFDANMNGRGKTLAAAYSPRPSPGGGVSMPLAWEELAGADPRAFDVRTVPGLLAQSGDPWFAIGTARRTLGAP